MIVPIRRGGPVRLGGLAIATLLCWSPLLMTGACIGLSRSLGCVAGQPCLLRGADIDGPCNVVAWAAWVTLLFPSITIVFWLALGARGLWRLWR